MYRWKVADNLTVCNKVRDPWHNARWSAKSTRTRKLRCILDTYDFKISRTVYIVEIMDLEAQNYQLLYLRVECMPHMSQIHDGVRRPCHESVPKEWRVGVFFLINISLPLAQMLY